MSKLNSVQKPFILVGVVWFLCGTGVTLAFAPSHVTGSALPWYLLVFALCALNLFFLRQLMNYLFRMTTNQDANLRGPLMTQTFFWAVLKFACLGLIIFTLVQAKGVSPIAWLMGIGTLIVIPLVGGFFSSRQALTSSRTEYASRV